MYHFEKKNSKISSPERPRENIWGPRKSVSPCPAVALDGPDSIYHFLPLCECKTKTKATWQNAKSLSQVYPIPDILHSSGGSIRLTVGLRFTDARFGWVLDPEISLCLEEILGSKLQPKRTSFLGPKAPI